MKDQDSKFLFDFTLRLRAYHSVWDLNLTGNAMGIQAWLGFLIDHLNKDDKLRL